MGSSQESSREAALKRGFVKVFESVLNMVVPSAHAIEEQPIERTHQSQTSSMTPCFTELGAAHPSSARTQTFDPDAFLEVNWGQKALIGMGRSFTEAGQGIHQLGLIVGERFGWVIPEELAAYTESILAEEALYRGTPVARSKMG